MVNASQEVRLEEAASRETLEKLREFVTEAKEAYGFIDSCHRRTWYDFVMAVALNDEDIPASTLSAWLVRERAWPQEPADSLARTFQYHVELLKYYRARFSEVPRPYVSG